MPRISYSMTVVVKLDALAAVSLSNYILLSDLPAVLI
jgi:hypothetical protein